MIEKIDLKTYIDITKILGVILDNAIDGARESDIKEIELDFKIDGNYMIMSISNTYNDEYIDCIGKKKFTTKGFGHGYGLLLAKEIVKNNSKIELVSDMTEKMFKQTILVEINNK